MFYSPKQHLGKKKKDYLQKPEHNLFHILIVIFTPKHTDTVTFLKKFILIRLFLTKVNQIEIGNKKERKLLAFSNLML